MYFFGQLQQHAQAELMLCDLCAADLPNEFWREPIVARPAVVEFPGELA
ncbi:MAG: hypothetical protein IT328_04930 [Caldilineaceae bacterium]|nr:hypothetical protein [Caldilineaceae bacterium]